MSDGMGCCPAIHVASASWKDNSDKIGRRSVMMLKSVMGLQKKEQASSVAKMPNVAALILLVSVRLL